MDKLVLIEVRGGVVQEVTADPELTVFTMDYDNLEGGVDYCPVCDGWLDAGDYCPVCNIAWGGDVSTQEVLKAIRQLTE